MIGLALMAGGTLLGGLMSSNAASDAADTQAGAANQAAILQSNQYNQNVARESPWVNAGSNALGTLQALLGAGGTNGPLTRQFTPEMYQKSPAFNFLLNNGLNAITNQASATGGVGGGNTLKALMNYGTGLADTDYQQQLGNYTNWQDQVYNMLNGISNQGLNAANSLNSNGTQSAALQGSDLIGAGNALAAGQVASGNAWGNALTNMGNMGMYAGLMSSMNQPQTFNAAFNPELQNVQPMFNINDGMGIPMTGAPNPFI